MKNFRIIPEYRITVKEISKNFSNVIILIELKNNEVIQNFVSVKFV
jgi:hypothetical protein